jgi:sigma-B regulation protein RsbU (phosphoserine phosphatase)
MLGGFIDQGPIWIVFAPIASTGWALATAVAESKMTAHVRDQLLLAATALSVLFFLIVCSVLFVCKNLTDPIRRLAHAVKRIRAGELDSKVTDITSSDEIGQLATGFNAMVDRLSEHVAALSSEMAARELVESELQVAREMQSSLLPMTYRPFPDRNEFDLYARNGAARHVAGDFYDFSLLTKTP